MNTTNFNWNPQVKSLIPSTPNGKPKTKVALSRPRYNGPVYLPKHIYDMLNEEAKKELDNYNKEKKANYQPNSNRMAKSMSKITVMEILLKPLNLIWTSTILRTHILCRTQLLKS